MLTLPGLRLARNPKRSARGGWHPTAGRFAHTIDWLGCATLESVPDEFVVAAEVINRQTDDDNGTNTFRCPAE